MAFDLASAKPVTSGFDLASAKPVSPPAVADTTPAATPGNTLLGEGELLGSGIANIPHAAAHAVVDLTRRLTGGDTDAPDPKFVDALHVPTGEAGKNLVKNVSDLLPKPNANNAADVIDAARTARLQQLPQIGSQDVVQDVVGHAGNVAQDVGALAPVVGAAKSVAGGIQNSLKEALTDAAAKPGWKAPPTPSVFEQTGLRTADNNPIARNAAGQSGKEALALHNRPVANTVAANEAGTPAGAPITQDSLIEARKVPGAVEDRVAAALPTGALDSTAAAGIRSAGIPAGGRITAGSPAAQQQIEALRSRLLDPDSQFTGRQVVNEVRGLRQEGFSNVASDDISNQQLGKAQIDMARALEGHIDRNLPAGGNVSQAQYLAARKALAKSYTVQSALRGNDVDMKVLARAYRADPQLLDGGTRTLAQFADEHPEVASLPSDSTRYNPPGKVRDISDVDLKKPSTYVQPLVGAAARRVLTGSQEEAIAQANKMYPPRDPSVFAPIPPPPKPPIAGLLEAPKPPATMVNAGGGATTPAALNDLGLTPDVQNAAAAHPGAPRPGVPLPAPAAPTPAPVEFQPQQNWSSVLQPNGPVPAAAPRSPTSMYADVLSQGVEKPPAPGLSLAPDAPRASNTIPFRRNADFEAGDLKLAPENAWFKPGSRSAGEQYADVLSGKIPNKFRDRGAPTTNNASGESAASVEAINRGARPLATIDPDGNEHALLKDVTQVDRKAPKGSLIIDTSTGEIIDRGGMNAAQANGLRNRWAAQTPEQQRLRLQAQALRN